ncbi:hypothetical protein L7F22_025556 [Adiantum nelumboides]|nr:hypothetical protein [Adiantum nelumboides]
MAHLPQAPTIAEQLLNLQQSLTYERMRRQELEDKLLYFARTKSASPKQNKISRKAFTFKDFDGTKDASTVLAWVSQLDDYFHDEDFLEREMISKKQPTVALSSTEAEYKAACFAACEAIWLRSIVIDLGVPMKTTTTLHCDNQSCMAISKNPVLHARTRHIEIQYHYVQKLIEDEIVELEYCSIEDNYADIFTKALGKDHLL